MSNILFTFLESGFQHAYGFFDVGEEFKSVFNLSHPTPDHYQKEHCE